MVWPPQPDRCIVQRSISLSIGSSLPTYEQTLLRFFSHLADRLHHSSIKVYLSAIWSLHIDQGFPDPLVNCLQLQRFLRGIKHHQGSTLRQCQPVTADLMHIIQRSLDTHNSEHVMPWTASFEPSIHLTVQDLQVDAEVNPPSLCICIITSKTDPFHQGCSIYLGRGQAPFCPVSAVFVYLHLEGPSSDPRFIDTHVRPLTCLRQSSFAQSVLQEAGIPR